MLLVDLLVSVVASEKNQRRIRNITSFFASGPGSHLTLIFLAVENPPAASGSMGKNALPSGTNTYTLFGDRGDHLKGMSMSRSAHLRFVAILYFSVAAASLVAPSAHAFSVGSGGTAEGSNSSFGDPDDQVNKALGLGPSEEPSHLGSPAPINPQPGKANPYKNWHFDSLASPPNPLSRPSN
jgi:hypothetical protein